MQFILTHIGRIPRYDMLRYQTNYFAYLSTCTTDLELLSFTPESCYFGFEKLYVLSRIICHGHGGNNNSWMTHSSLTGKQISGQAEGHVRQSQNILVTQKSSSETFILIRLRILRISFKL
jgi:hypothetical protein